MAVNESDCLDGCLGVDSVTGLPSVRYDPAGAIECGPNGVRARVDTNRNIGIVGNRIVELCEQNALGVVNGSVAGATAMGIAVPGGLAPFNVVASPNPYITSVSWTNPGPCRAYIIGRVAVRLQGINCPASSQGPGASVSIEASTNGSPYGPIDYRAFALNATAPNGWQAEFTGFEIEQRAFLNSGASITFAFRAVIRSTPAILLDAYSALSHIEAWRVSG
jgi:hypothetical protein